MAVFQRTLDIPMSYQHKNIYFKDANISTTLRVQHFVGNSQTCKLLVNASGKCWLHNSAF